VDPAVLLHSRPIYVTFYPITFHFTLTMEEAVSSEMSVSNCNTTGHHNPKDLDLKVYEVCHRQCKIRAGGPKQKHTSFPHTVQWYIILASFL